MPQSGHDGPPEVLFRFQAAVLGIGRITGPDDDDLYLWRAGGGAESQATIALIWSQLGNVKRVQAAAAMRAVLKQYEVVDGLRPRAPRRRASRPVHSDHFAFINQSISEPELDMAWGAGFLDGEGNFGLPRAGSRAGAPDWRRIRVSAAQHGRVAEPPEVLARMQTLLGGRIEIHGEPDDFRWTVEGVDHVEDIVLRVRHRLGTTKQEQACSAIRSFRTQVRFRGTETRCVRGHVYDHVYVGVSGTKKKCNACARILSRQNRAARGIKPRQFKNVARRYNF